MSDWCANTLTVIGPAGDVAVVRRLLGAGAGAVADEIGSLAWDVAAGSPWEGVALDGGRAAAWCEFDSRDVPHTVAGTALAALFPACRMSLAFEEPFGDRYGVWLFGGGRRELILDDRARPVRSVDVEVASQRGGLPHTLAALATGHRLARRGGGPVLDVAVVGTVPPSVLADIGTLDAWSAADPPRTEGLLVLTLDATLAKLTALEDDPTWPEREPWLTHLFTAAEAPVVADRLSRHTRSRETAHVLAALLASASGATSAADLVDLVGAALTRVPAADLAAALLAMAGSREAPETVLAAALAAATAPAA